MSTVVKFLVPPVIWRIVHINNLQPKGMAAKRKYQTGQLHYLFKDLCIVSHTSVSHFDHLHYDPVDLIRLLTYTV